MASVFRQWARLFVVAALSLTFSSAAWSQPPSERGGGNLLGAPGAAGGEEAKAVSVSGEFTAPADGKPGQLFVTAKMLPGWHIYSITQKEGGPIVTQIKLAKSAHYRLAGKFQAVESPKSQKEPAFDNLVVETHEGRVTWIAPIELAAGDPAKVEIHGAVYAQACQATNCRMPQDYKFTAHFRPAAAKAAASQAVPLAQTSSPENNPPQPGSPAMESAPAAVDWNRLATQLGFAFLGGLILNLMPCVLPVISLKALSFLEQAGQSRGRIFALNVWYSVGVISVFLVLAALAAGAKQAWGEQFTLPWFKVAMTGLVFAMALSFLGVWEIPIPGFLGSGRSGQLQMQEGASGAFFKGVFATILATPCSGPFLGPVFAYVLTQPPVVAYCIFAAVGLGMASPYLLLSVFPHALGFLPRPGAWMETFKEVMGFFLLGTVVYLFTTLNAAYFIPTLTLLVGLWFGAWLIGRTPLGIAPWRRALAWAASIAAAVGVGVFAFTILLDQPRIAWQRFSPEALATARGDGKTVMVDFSANWCPTCKLNLRLAVDTEKVAQVVERNRVAPMLADWTDRSPAIKRTINELGYNSIPLLVIYPAGNSQSRPKVLTDLLSESQVLEALDQAGPSRK